MIFLIFVAKPDTLESKLESMTAIQEVKDGFDAGAFVAYKVSSLLDIAMGMNISINLTYPFSMILPYFI